MSYPQLLSEEQVAQFNRDGLLLLPDFFNVTTEIEPIQRHIHAIIGLLIEKHGLPVKQPAFTPLTFDAGYQALIAHDRALGGVVYDAVKHIPSFVRLVVHPKNEALLAQLRRTRWPGLASRGYGIRIDNPNEERFRATWHQEYPAQLRSLDGLVLWSPLLPITPELGPVQFAVGSHVEGLQPVLQGDPAHPSKTHAYGLVIADEARLIKQYPIVAPLTSPGDLVVVDFLTVHQSGFNRSDRSRWSMQSRYFNFLHPSGRDIHWSGSYADGVNPADVHPEMILEPR